MSRSDSPPLNAKTFHVLLALSTKAHHGYGLKKSILERTKGAINLDPGGLYRLIARLEEDGLVTPVRAPADAGDVRRRYYELTSLGSAALRAEASRLSALIASPEVAALFAQGGEAK